MPLPASLANSLELPVVGSPLFIVSGPELVIAQCKAGIVGSFPALNARPVEKLDEWLTRIENELGEYKAQNPGKKVAPYAVNQICHASNDRLMKDMETCVKHKVPIIITSLRPPIEIVEAAHSYGGVVFHDVINVKHARKAAEQGVDGLILVCAGAGGHAGTLSPFALLREVKQWFKGTILLSGAISDGWGIASALALGADMAYMGTRFIATAEANADPAYKAALVEHAAHDIVYSNLFTGVHGNYLGPSIAAAGLDPANLPDSRQVEDEFRLRRQHEVEGVARHLGLRPGHRPDRGRAAGRRTGRAAEGRVRRRQQRLPQAGARVTRADLASTINKQTEGWNNEAVATCIDARIRVAGKCCGCRATTTRTKSASARPCPTAARLPASASSAGRRRPISRRSTPKAASTAARSSSSASTTPTRRRRRSSRPASWSNRTKCC